MTQNIPRPLAKCIVLVDDEAAYLELLSEQVTAQFACPVHSFLSAKEALQALPGLNVGLIITDFQMPGLNGFQFIRRVQRLLPGMPVLMITAVADQFLEDEIQELPALKVVLHKPFKWAELAAHIARHWAASSPPSLATGGG